MAPPASTAACRDGQTEGQGETTGRWMSSSWLLPQGSDMESDWRVLRKYDQFVRTGDGIPDPPLRRDHLCRSKSMRCFSACRCRPRPACSAKRLSVAGVWCWIVADAAARRDRFSPAGGGAGQGRTIRRRPGPSRRLRFRRRRRGRSAELAGEHRRQHARAATDRRSANAARTDHDRREGGQRLDR
jgi:hypothetical protein